MFKIKEFLFILIYTFFVQLTAGVDPFSKITITSEKAVCKKSNTVKDIFIFNYVGDVVVTLADASKITAGLLEVTLDGKGIKIFEEHKQTARKMNKSQNRSNKNPTQVKKIIFKNRVHIINQNRQAFSDTAEIDMFANTCRLDGNVRIIQSKAEQKRDIPLNVKSNSALINLKNSEITLLGNSSEPVSTIVELGKGILTSSTKKPGNE